LPDDGKEIKERYFFKSSARGDGTPEDPYTPASKQKKIKITGLRRPPRYKVNAKKNIIKYKPNTYVSINGGEIEYKSGKGVQEIAEGNVYEFWHSAEVRKPASAVQMLP
ncbi:MAG: hypothetical protein FWH04_09640, partial [Oscillospiraceae bacterium]|nr:hypothetical protein [Oscillospiraceae bacterium]